MVLLLRQRAFGAVLKGRKAGSTWYFYFDEPFDYEGRTAVQRQWWERSGDRIKRHFENSYDNGQTWVLVMTAVLRRVGGVRS